MTTTYGQRLATAIDSYGNLCVGIDPHESLLSQWGLPLSAEGVERFFDIVIAAVAGRAPAIKPQIALFERFGSAGYGALERCYSRARDAGLLIVSDIKRGDMGTSMVGYESAWLGADAILPSDAITVHPFLGMTELQSTVDAAEAAGAGLYVLAATSNASGAEFQGSRDAAGRTVSGRVVAALVAHNSAVRGAVASTGAPDGTAVGSMGVVIGAQVNLLEMGIDVAQLSVAPVLPILAPGVGAQGAPARGAAALFGDVARAGLLVSSSRAVLSAGPDGIAGAITSTSAELRAAVN